MSQMTRNKQRLVCNHLFYTLESSGYASVISGSFTSLMLAVTVAVASAVTVVVAVDLRGLRRQHKQYDPHRLMKLRIRVTSDSWGGSVAEAAAPAAAAVDAAETSAVRVPSCIEANSSSICSVVRSLLNSSVWSLLNSMIDSMRFLITPVSTSVCK